MLIDLSLKINPKHATHELAKLGHYGTHVDIMDANNMLIENFITTGKLIDITAIRDTLVHLEDIINLNDINEKDFVVFRSGWLKDKTYGTQGYFLNHPHLADDIIDFLIEKKISFIGLDFPGAQREALHLEVDKKCAENGVFIIENLNNLDQINQTVFEAYCFPMNLAGSTGIPIRVLAKLN